MMLESIAEQAVKYLLGQGDIPGHFIFCDEPVIKIDNIVNSGRNALSKAVLQINEIYKDTDQLSVEPVKPCQSVITEQGTGMIMGSFDVMIHRGEEHIRRSIDMCALICDELINMLHFVVPQDKDREYTIKSGRVLFCYKEDQIMYIESDKIYSLWYVNDPKVPSRKYITEKATLSSHQKQLSDAFIKVGRKYYVNMNHIRATYIEKDTDEYFIIMSNDHRIKVPNTTYKSICTSIGAWKKMDAAGWMAV